MLSRARALTDALQFHAAEFALENATSALGDAKDPALTAAIQIQQSIVLGLSGRVTESLALAKRTLASATRHRITGAIVASWCARGLIAAYMAEHGRAAKAYARAAARCAPDRERASSDLCRACLARAHFRRGDWKTSAALARRIIAGESRDSEAHAVATGTLGLLYCLCGDTTKAAKLLGHSLELGRSLGLKSIGLLGLSGLAMIAEIEERDLDAAAHYEALLDAWRTTEDSHVVIPGMTCAVAFFANRHIEESAAAFAECLEEIAVAAQKPEATAAAAVARGEIRLLEDNPDFAVAEFRLAVSNFKQCRLPLELVRTRLRLGVALMHTGELREARKALERSLMGARLLGARPTMIQIKTALDILTVA